MIFLKVNGSITAILTEMGRKILSFGELPYGWHYGEGEPIAHPIITQALQINEKMEIMGLQTNTFPGYNGEIQVNGYRGNYTLEFIIEQPDDITYIVEEYDEELSYEEHLSLSEVLNKIECDISDSFATRHMTNSRKDSAMWNLRTPQMEVAYQLYP